MFDALFLAASSNIYYSYKIRVFFYSLFVFFLFLQKKFPIMHFQGDLNQVCQHRIVGKLKKKINYSTQEEI